MLQTDLIYMTVDTCLRGSCGQLSYSCHKFSFPHLIHKIVLSGQSARVRFVNLTRLFINFFLLSERKVSRNISISTDITILEITILEKNFWNIFFSFRIIDWTLMTQVTCTFNSSFANRLNLLDVITEFVLCSLVFAIWNGYAN